MRRFRPWAAVILATLFLAACGGPAPDPAAASDPDAREAQIAEVTKALMALGPGVNPKEASRAARIAVEMPLQWAKDWNVVDAPLVHNFKVIHGLREKGLCRHWADALQRAMAAEGFRTLALHRAIANAHTVSLEHATLILSARGQGWEDGLILDPWRIGQGRLWFGRLADDTRYTWESAATVRARAEAQQARALTTR
ncbi:lipoprotein [Thalassococcus sp. BH17M4-6]|uniref:LptM family lipoprotein n=1 Tax=Thalassococcus sp. BH17M4-6 TaxID=3413148 RepID=UPI003BC74A58